MTYDVKNISAEAFTDNLEKCNGQVNEGIFFIKLPKAKNLVEFFIIEASSALECVFIKEDVSTEKGKECLYDVYKAVFNLAEQFCALYDIDSGDKYAVIKMRITGELLDVFVHEP